MKLEFQVEILKYLLQNPTTVRLVEGLNKDIFSNEEHKEILLLIKKFIKKYKRMPTKLDLEHYLVTIQKKVKYSNEDVEVLQDEIHNLWKPLKTNEEFVSDTLVGIVQFEQIKNIIKEYAPILENGMEIWEKLKNDLDATLALSDDSDNEAETPTEIFSDWYNDLGKASATIHPTYLQGLNDFTNKGGFASPELIVLMGLPKAFKTGTILNILTPLAKMGLNVFVADFENGMVEVRNRMKQILTKTTNKELHDLDPTEVNGYTNFWKLFGGSIWVGSYTANVHTAKDVERDMKAITKEQGITFQAIGWDFADIMNSSVKEREKHERISRVYYEIIGVHKRQGCFGFTGSHTKQSAKGKFSFDKSDYADSWGKSKACHACYYIAQDELETQLGLARIGIVEQRSGRQFGFFPVKIDFPRQTLTELSEDEYNEFMEGGEDD